MGQPSIVAQSPTPSPSLVAPTAPAKQDSPDIDAFIKSVVSNIVRAQTALRSPNADKEAIAKSLAADFQKLEDLVSRAAEGKVAITPAQEHALREAGTQLADLLDQAPRRTGSGSPAASPSPSPAPAPAGTSQQSNQIPQTAEDAQKWATVRCDTLLKQMADEKGIDFKQPINHKERVKLAAQIADKLDGKEKEAFMAKMEAAGRPLGLNFGLKDVVAAREQHFASKDPRSEPAEVPMTMVAQAYKALHDEFYGPQGKPEAQRASVLNQAEQRQTAVLQQQTEEAKKKQATPTSNSEQQNPAMLERMLDSIQ